MLPLGPSGCSASQPASPGAAPCDCFFPSTQSVGRGMVGCNGEEWEWECNTQLHAVFWLLHTIPLTFHLVLTILVCSCFMSLESSSV